MRRRSLFRTNIGRRLAAPWLVPGLLAAAGLLSESNRSGIILPINPVQMRRPFMRAVPDEPSERHHRCRLLADPAGAVHARNSPAEEIDARQLVEQITATHALQVRPAQQHDHLGYQYDGVLHEFISQLERRICYDRINADRRVQLHQEVDAAARGRTAEVLEIRRDHLMPSSAQHLDDIPAATCGLPQVLWEWLVPQERFN